jgi:hypothetical protein
MRKNAIPAVVAFAPALLLPLVQNVVRPRVATAGPLGLVLSSAPDFVVGFCFPFSILIRPRAWTPRAAARLFVLWAILTAVALVLVEFLSPFGANVRDPADIVAAIGGVSLAILFYFACARAWLTYDEERSEEPAELHGPPPNER